MANRKFLIIFEILFHPLFLGEDPLLTMLKNRTNSVAELDSKIEEFRNS